MSWKDELHLLPSRQQMMLASLLGRPMLSLQGYSEESPTELLASDPYAFLGVTATQLFSRPDGPVALSCEGLPPVLIADSSELQSVTVQLADLAQLASEFPTTIHATDATYSEPRFARLIGRRIVEIRVLQRIANPDGRVMSQKVLDRPREAALVLEFDDANQLIFAYDVLNGPNDAVVLTDVRDLDASCYREILSLR